MIEEIRLNLSKRSIVFSTGHEVATGQIKDTNTPAIAETLEAEGYVVKRRIEKSNLELGAYNLTLGQNIHFGSCPWDSITISKRG